MSGINSLFSTALSGLNAGSAIINAAASNIANLATQGYKAARVNLTTAPDGDGVEVSSITHDSDVDLVNEVVSMKQGQILYQANAAVIRVGDQLTGSLLDILDTHNQRR
jgi:flagellar hook protein FlgE